MNVSKIDSVSVSKLPNSLNVASDFAPNFDTVVVMLGCKTGSRNENLKNNGISHFLEHMIFKGTKSRSAIDISRSIESLGGSYNAFTSKEKTVYYVKALREDLKKVCEIIADITQNSVFDMKEMNKERDVILQELMLSLDCPEDVVFDNFFKAAIDGSLAMPILGPAENIKRFNTEDMAGYINDRYFGSNAMLSMCGNIEHQECLDLANKYFSNMPAAPQGKDVGSNKNSYKGCYISQKKGNMSQIQIVMGIKAPNYQDIREYFVLSIACHILGGCSSSRLFQEIREKRGLSYSVSCFPSCYEDVGVMCIYGDCSPSKINEFMSVSISELQKAKDSITSSELQIAKNQFKAGLLMSLESNSSRARSVISDMFTRKRFIPKNEMVKIIEGIAESDVSEVLNKVFADTQKHSPSLSIHGNFDESKDYYKDFLSLFKN